jgi:hypothetical protein
VHAKTSLRGMLIPVEPSKNPLEVSPANPEVSKQRPGEEGGAESSPRRENEDQRSGYGSPKKGKKV